MKALLAVLLALSSPAMAALDPCTDTRLPIVSADPKADSWVKQYLAVFAASSNSFESAIEASDYCASEISRRLFNPAFSLRYVETLQLLNQADPTGEQGLGPLALRLQKDWEARYLWTYNAQKQNEMGTFRTRTMLIGLLGLAFQPVSLSNKLSSQSVTRLNIARAIFGAGTVTAHELAGKRVGIDRSGIRLFENSLKTPPAPALYIEFSNPAAPDLFAIDGQWQDEFRLRYQVYNDIALGFAINTAQGLKLFESLWSRLGIAEAGSFAQQSGGRAMAAKVGRGGAIAAIFLGLDFLVNGVAMDAYESMPVSDALNALQLKRNEYEISAQKLRATPDNSPARAEATRQVYQLANQFAHQAITLSQLLSRPYLKAYLNWMMTDDILQRASHKLSKATPEEIAAYRDREGDYKTNEFYIAKKVYDERAATLKPEDVESFNQVMASYGKSSGAAGVPLELGADPKDTLAVKEANLNNLHEELRKAAIDGGSATSSTLLGWLSGWLSSWFSTPTTFADPSFTPYLWFQFLQPPRFKKLSDASVPGELSYSRLESELHGLTPFEAEDRKRMDSLIAGLENLPEGADGKLTPRFAANLRRVMDTATEQLGERAAREGIDLAKVPREEKLSLWRRALFEYRGNLDRILSMWLQQNRLNAIDDTRKPRPDHVLLLASATLRNVLKEAGLTETPLYQQVEYLAQTTLTTKAGEYHFLLSRLFGEIPAAGQDAVDTRLWSILKHNSSWYQLYSPRGESPPMEDRKSVV